MSGRSSLRLPCSALVLLAAFAALPAAQAQNPVRLPQVTVTATQAPPGPKTLAGTVRDTSNAPIEGAEVTIPRLQRRIMTAENGTFRLGDLPRGKYEMRARKFGYAPQVREFEITAEGGIAEFELLPLPYSLPSVVTSVVRGGIMGVIADTSYAPLAEVEVRLAGKYMTSLTDSMGTFFIPAPPGNYMVAMKKAGYADRVTGVTVPDDSGRFVRTFLLPARPLATREAHNVEDLEQRLNWRNKLTDQFYTHEDIVRLGFFWIYDLVRSAGADQYDQGCVVVYNGGPATAKLMALTVDEVESVEVYGGSRFNHPKNVAQSRVRVPTTRNVRGELQTFQGSKTTDNTERAVLENGGKSCPMVYVWSR